MIGEEKRGRSKGEKARWRSVCQVREYFVHACAFILIYLLEQTRGQKDKSRASELPFKKKKKNKEKKNGGIRKKRGEEYCVNEN